MEDLSFGIGGGSLYNGLGANIAHKKNDSLRYFAIGCIQVSYGTGSGVKATCGFGTGYVKTNILSSSNKHGLGIHVGISVIGANVEGSDFGYQLGGSYVYFFQGIDSPGWNIGLTPSIDRYNGSNHIGGLFEVGYQY